MNTNIKKNKTNYTNEYKTGMKLVNSLIKELFTF